MNFRRPSYFNQLPSRRMYDDMLIEPWIREPELSLLGSRAFETELMSSVLDVSPQRVPVRRAPVVHINAPPAHHYSSVFVQILEPLALLERMNRMINRWIGVRRRRGVPLIRRNRPFHFRRQAIKQQAPIRRRQQRVRRQPVRRQSVRRVQPMRQQPVRSRSVQQPMQRRQAHRSRSVSVRRGVSQQPTWQHWQQPEPLQISSGVRGIRRQPSIGRKAGIQGIKCPSGVGRQQQSMQMPIQKQQRQKQFGQMGKQLPIQSTNVKRSTSQQRSSSLGRRVPIQSQQSQQQQQFGVKSNPKQQRSFGQFGQTGVSSNIGNIGKLSKAAQPVTGRKLPQLYRICLNTQGCNTKDIKCNVQKTPTGQCNMIITGCGPYRRCYTLPNMCDHKRMKKYVTRDNMCVIECPLLEETPRCLDITTQPQIREDSLSLKVNIPEFIDPNKVQVNLLGNDLILRFETKCTTTECATRVHYYNKVTLPKETNLEMLKCQCVKGCLIITAPIIGGRKQQQKGGRQVGLGREESPEEVLGGGIQRREGKKPRHRVLQRQQEQQRLGGGVSQISPQKQQKQKGLKGVEPTTKVSQKREKTQITKLPKPEEINIGGVQQKQTRKTGPVAPQTQRTQVTKPKETKKKQQAETPVSRVQETKPSKKQGKKEQKEGGVKQQQKGRISGAQQLHEIFASGTSGSEGKKSPERQERQQEEPRQMGESMGRPVSPTKL